MRLIREIVLRGDVVVEKIAFVEKLADPFMKTLSMITTQKVLFDSL